MKWVAIWMGEGVLVRPKWFLVSYTGYGNYKHWRRVIDTNRVFEQTLKKCYTTLPTMLSQVFASSKAEVVGCTYVSPSFFSPHMLNRRYVSRQTLYQTCRPTHRLTHCLIYVAACINGATTD